MDIIIQCKYQLVNLCGKIGAEQKHQYFYDFLIVNVFLGNFRPDKGNK
jgi:hypothetical protein